MEYPRENRIIAGNTTQMARSPRSYLVVYARGFPLTNPIVYYMLVPLYITHAATRAKQAVSLCNYVMSRIYITPVDRRRRRDLHGSVQKLLITRASYFIFLRNGVTHIFHTDSFLISK